MRALFSCFTVNINGHTSYHDGKYYETCSDCLLSEDTTLLPDRSSKGRYLFLFSKVLPFLHFQCEVWNINSPYYVSCPSSLPPGLFSVSPPLLACFMVALPKHEPVRWSRPSWRPSRSRQSVLNSPNSTTLEAQVRLRCDAPHRASRAVFSPHRGPLSFRSVSGWQAIHYTCSREHRGQSNCCWACRVEPCAQRACVQTHPA